MVDHVDSNIDKQYKLKECQDILLIGGYFRCKLNNISNFDKVVGGMVWAVTASNVDTDIDIIFQENSTIGQKIKLSDKLVKSLVKMKCPYQLQSHQIQGLDLDKIYPVIQWLIKKVLETRSITGDLIRQYSVSQFSKHYNVFPSEIRTNDANNYLNNTISSYKPKRKYRKPVGGNFNSVESHVEATLLEYGQKVLSSSLLEETDVTTTRGSIDNGEPVTSNTGAAVGKLSGALTSIANKLGGNVAGATAEGVAASNATTTTKKKEEDAKIAAEKKLEEEKRLENVADSMDAAEDASRISGLGVGKILSLQADEIKIAAEAYVEPTISEMPANKVQDISHARQVENLNRTLAAALAKHEELESAKVKAIENYREVKASVKEQLQTSESLSTKTAELDEIESSQSDANKEVIKKLKTLVAMNEVLKKQEAAFKQSCKDNLAQLQDAIKKLDAADPEDEEVARLLEIEAIFGADSDKHSKLRAVLAKKNQEIASVMRQIDDIPTRAELLQYERRFVELYTLVNDKLKETRKYYALYNTLADTRTYLGKEVSLLESICGGFTNSMKSAPGKENFLAAFSTILDGVDKSITKVKEDFDFEIKMLEKKSNTYNALVEEQRTYFKTVKSFQDECFKNEQMMEMLAEKEKEGQE